MCQPKREKNQSKNYTQKIKWYLNSYITTGASIPIWPTQILDTLDRDSCWPSHHQCSLPLSLIHYPYTHLPWPPCPRGPGTTPAPPLLRLAGTSTTPTITSVSFGLQFPCIDPHHRVNLNPLMETTHGVGPVTGRGVPSIPINVAGLKARVRHDCLWRTNPTCREVYQESFVNLETPCVNV